MSITRLPQGSSLPTHKSLLLWHRWDKIDQLPNPAPKLPSSLVTEQDPLPLGNLPLILSPLTWPPGLVLATPALFPQAKCSGILLLQGWGLGARGAHVYGGACSVQGCTHVLPAPPLPVPHPTYAKSPCEVQEERPPQEKVPVCYMHTPWTHKPVVAQKQREHIQDECQVDITAHRHSGRSSGGL